MKTGVLALLVLLLILAVALACGQSRESTTAPVGNELELTDRIRVSSPRPNESVRSPLLIEGEAVGSWYFEASFPARVVDANGFTLGLVPVEARGDWMTESFVPFRAEMPFARPSSATGHIELHRDNPSGLSEHDAVLSMPVRFGDAPAESGETMTTTVFLSDSAAAAGPPFDCAKTVAVERVVPRTERVAQAAIEALLRGATAAELLEGHPTSLPPGVELNSLSIEDGLARADFSAQLEYRVGGACRVTSIRAQIADTLTQFGSVTNVVISVDGRVDDVLQP